MNRFYSLLGKVPVLVLKVASICLVISMLLLYVGNRSSVWWVIAGVALIVLEHIFEGPFTRWLKQRSGEGP